MEFNNWLFEQLGGSGSTFDDVLTIVERVIKVIKIIKDIISILGLIVIPVGSTLEHNINSDEATEYLLALEEAFEKGYVHPQFYTKEEVDEFLTELDAQFDDYYDKNETNVILSSKVSASTFNDTVTQIDNAIANKASASSLLNYTTTSVLNTTYKETLLGICYPIGSFFFYEQKITFGADNKPTIVTNTILDYFEWEIILPANQRDFGVFGFCGGNPFNAPTPGLHGSDILTVDNLPPHSHKGLVSSYHQSTSGSGAWTLPTDASNAVSNGSGVYNTNSDVILKNSVGTESNLQYTYNSGISPYNPYGYYTYCYKRIA